MRREAGKACSLDLLYDQERQHINTNSLQFSQGKKEQRYDGKIFF